MLYKYNWKKEIVTSFFGKHSQLSSFHLIRGKEAWLISGCFMLPHTSEIGKRRAFYEKAPFLSSPLPPPHLNLNFINPREDETQTLSWKEVGPLEPGYHVASSDRSSILISGISALCFEVKWFHTATKLAPTSPFHQLPCSLYHCSQEDIIKKIRQCQPTVTGFYFKIILCWLYLYKTLCHIL